MCSFPQETEVAVQAKQPDVEGILSKGQRLYKEQPATQPVKVMKQPLSNIHYLIMGYASLVVHLPLTWSIYNQWNNLLRNIGHPTVAESELSF